MAGSKVGEESEPTSFASIHKHLPQAPTTYQILRTQGLRHRPYSQSYNLMCKPKILTLGDKRDQIKALMSPQESQEKIHIICVLKKQEITKGWCHRNQKKYFQQKKKISASLDVINGMLYRISTKQRLSIVSRVQSMKQIFGHKTEVKGRKMNVLLRNLSFILQVMQNYQRVLIWEKHTIQADRSDNGTDNGFEGDRPGGLGDNSKAIVIVK